MNLTDSINHIKTLTQDLIFTNNIKDSIINFLSIIIVILLFMIMYELYKLIKR